MGQQWKSSAGSISTCKISFLQFLVSPHLVTLHLCARSALFSLLVERASATRKVVCEGRCLSFFDPARENHLFDRGAVNDRIVKTFGGAVLHGDVAIFFW